MLELSYEKTDAGRAEIKSRALALSRSARNLLLMLDSSRSAGEWLSMVRGATAGDAAFLLGQGLIESTRSAIKTAVSTLTAAEAKPVGFALSPLSYEQLYSYLTRHAKQYLGLMKGYRMVLDVERCADLDALRHLAARFAADVLAAHGESVAEQVRRALDIKPQA